MLCVGRGDVSRAAVGKTEHPVLRKIKAMQQIHRARGAFKQHSANAQQSQPGCAAATGRPRAHDQCDIVVVLFHGVTKGNEKELARVSLWRMVCQGMEWG